MVNRGRRFGVLHDKSLQRTKQLTLAPIGNCLDFFAQYAVAVHNPIAEAMHQEQPILTAAVMSARSRIFPSDLFQLAALCSRLPKAWASVKLKFETIESARRFF